jgi:hypothetical protein
MTIPVQQFQILSPEQANPIGRGMQTGEEIYRNFIANKYLPEQLQQQARQRELENQTSELNLKDLPGYLKARLSGMNLSNQTSQTNLKYLPQKSQLGIEGQQLSNSGQLINNNMNQLKYEDLPESLKLDRLSKILANYHQSLSNTQTDINNQSLPARNQAGLQNTQLRNQKLGIENKYLPAQSENNALNTYLKNQQLSINNEHLPEQLRQEELRRDIDNNIANVQSKYAEPNAQQDLRNKLITQEQKQQMAINSASQIDTIKQNNRDYQKELNTASTDADTNRRLEKSVDQLVSAYKNLTPRQKGPIYGHFPAFSSESQIADNAANNLQAEMAKIMQSGGRNTNFLTKFAGTLKPNRAMSPEAVNQLSEGLRANSRRQQERPGFLVAAKERGIDAQTAKVLWNQYDEQNPVYDFDKRQVNKYKDKNYKDYLSDKAVNSVKQGELYQPNQNQGMVEIQSPSGKRFRISSDKLNEAIKRGAKQVS